MMRFHAWHVRLKEMVVGSPDPAATLLATAGIGLPAAVAFAVCARRLRGGFAVS